MRLPPPSSSLTPTRVFSLSGFGLWAGVAEHATLAADVAEANEILADIQQMELELARLRTAVPIADVRAPLLSHHLGVHRLAVRLTAHKLTHPWS